MSIDQTKVIDASSLSEDAKEVRLFLFDHLSWEDINDNHLVILQEKINTYLAYIEGGQMYEENPEYKDKPVVINVIAKYSLPENDIVKKFYEKVTSVVQWAGFELRFENIK